MTLIQRDLFWYRCVAKGSHYSLKPLIDAVDKGVGRQDVNTHTVRKRERGGGRGRERGRERARERERGHRIQRWGAFCFVSYNVHVLSDGVIIYLRNYYY